MSNQEQPQIYLISPPVLELSRFGEQLAEILDAVEIACFRLSLASVDEQDVSRAADHLRQICHQRDVAIVMDKHIHLSQTLGLDGVHLMDGARSVRRARKDLGPDAIVGAFCATSRHDGLNAGESSADYVSFGPVGASALGDGSVADPDLFAWWSEMIEVPIVAEGALDETHIAQLAPVTDFFGIGTEIWQSDTPLATLRELISVL